MAHAKPRRWEDFYREKRGTVKDAFNMRHEEPSPVPEPEGSASAPDQSGSAQVKKSAPVMNGPKPPPGIAHAIARQLHWQALEADKSSAAIVQETRTKTATLTQQGDQSMSETTGDKKQPAFEVKRGRFSIKAWENENKETGEKFLSPTLSIGSKDEAGNWKNSDHQLKPDDLLKLNRLTDIGEKTFADTVRDIRAKNAERSRENDGNERG